MRNTEPTMIKKVFILLFLLLIATYLVIAVTTFNAKPDKQTCEGMELVINDSIDYGFITEKEILRLLTKEKLSPIGKNMDEINTRLLEDALKKHPLVGEVQCFRIPNGKVGIEVTQRIPLLRIMAANGENYYLDDKGVKYSCISFFELLYNFYFNKMKEGNYHGKFWRQA